MSANRPVDARRGDRGFSVIELIAVMAVAAIVGAIAIPQMQQMVASMRLGAATREVERELQTARLKAVSTNRRLRVRMNCPAAGYYRTVEFLGTAADNAANRCLPTAGNYPYPPADTDPLTVPNLDGPVRSFYQGVTVPTTTFEFRPDGTAWTVDVAGVAQPIPVGGVQLIVTRLSKTKAIEVNALGKIRIPIQ